MLTTLVNCFDQGVRIFRADAVNELPVRPLGARCRPAAFCSSHGTRAGRGRARGHVARRQGPPSFEDQDEHQVHEAHGVQNTSLVSLQGCLDGVGEVSFQQSLCVMTLEESMAG
jgi:hypothetical protein